MRIQNRDLRELAQSLEGKGWKIEASTKHIKWLSPGGQIVISSATPSDHRAMKNHLSLIKRAERMEARV